MQRDFIPDVWSAEISAARTVAVGNCLSAVERTLQTLGELPSEDGCHARNGPAPLLCKMMQLSRNSSGLWIVNE